MQSILQSRVFSAWGTFIFFWAQSAHMPTAGNVVSQRKKVTQGYRSGLKVTSEGHGEVQSQGGGMQRESCFSFIFSPKLEESKSNGKIGEVMVCMCEILLCLQNNPKSKCLLRRGELLFPTFFPTVGASIQHLSGVRLLTYTIHGAFQYWHFICLSSRVTQ